MTAFLCLAAIFVYSSDAQVFPSLLGRIGGTPIEQAVLLSSLYLLYPISSVLAGYAADRVGKRAVLILGAAVMGAPFLIAALVPDLRVWTVSVLLFGVGSAILEGQASALLSDVSPGRERAVLNLSQAFYSVGATGGPALIAFALSFSGGGRLSAVLWGAAALSFALCLGFLLMRDWRASGPAERPVRPAELARNPVWRLLALALFVYVAAETGTASWLAKYGHEILGMPEATAPLCISLFWGGLGVSRAILGLARVPLGDRTILLGANLAALACQVAAFSLRSPVLALPAFALLGFSLGAVWPTLVAAAGRMYRSSSGAGVGAMVAAGALAVPLIQPVIGALSQPGLLGLRWTLLSLSLLLLAGALITVRVFGRSAPAARGSPR